MKDWLRNKAQNALNLGAPLFVTEYGASFGSGNGNLDLPETQKWCE
jgi:hypothetical protein